MPAIILIDKSGIVKSAVVKDVSPESLCRKAGFKSFEGFVLRHTWGQEDGIDANVSVYAKITGRTGQENKYDFPPPIDETLFFGTCVLIGRNSKTNDPIDLTVDDWDEIYEFLFGGFEDLNKEDTESSCSIDESELNLTSQGYVKDGFIVSSEDEEEEEPVIKPKSKKPAAPKKTAAKKKIITYEALVSEECGDELSLDTYE
jgi:hypothetical protein